MIVSLNGRLVPEKNAHISIHDRGFLLGDGLYETLRVYGGKPFLLEDHLRRLQTGLAFVGIAAPINRIRDAVLAVIRANKWQGGAVRITVTRGVGGPGLDPRTAKRPTILVTGRPFAGYPVRFSRKGMTAAVVSVRRNDPAALPPALKSISCLNNVLAKREALAMKADEAIFLTAEGSVAEGASTNVFTVKDGRLFTPALDGHQLAGVTRAFINRLARAEGIPVIEAKMSTNELFSADEMFFTNALMEIMPVSALLAKGRARRVWKIPGPITAALSICYTAARFRHMAATADKSAN